MPNLRRRRGRRRHGKSGDPAAAAVAPAAGRPTRPRPAAYYAIAGLRLDEEMDRLRALPVFAGGPLAERRPELKVRRARVRPNRLGFAVPAEHRISVTAYSGARAGDLLETLLHELVHLHVGRAREAHAWHGRSFKRTLAQAMREAYGVEIAIPRASLHGPYAEAIENRRATVASASWRR